MLKLIALSGSILALAAPARAQVTIDVSKITCDQYVGYKVTNPQNIAIWLSGYYSGKRDSTVTRRLSWRMRRRCGIIAFAIRKRR